MKSLNEINFENSTDEFFLEGLNTCIYYFINDGYYYKINNFTYFVKDIDTTDKIIKNSILIS